MSGEDRGDLVVAAARAWIGTPYRHQGSRKGVGCDCLGLVRGVWAEVMGRPAEQPGAYAPDWAERGRTDRLIIAARRHCGAAIPVSQARAGDILLFRWRDGVSAKHAGLLSDADHFIHAYEAAGVVESVLVPGWRRRIAAVHRFPFGPDHTEALLKDH
ncbi:MAG: NlpC/P60 family protein [Hoeflea sp.]|uniref:NlpC/P60 family protein n=1 Tax=Hoeflea sp. TaxID=1940281 RepID=UPI00329680E1|tara:strand:+ start:427 stop:900 length:474 start_codon:yes stop_codon:yes gene_type:complete